MDACVECYIAIKSPHRAPERRNVVLILGLLSLLAVVIVFGFMSPQEAFAVTVTVNNPTPCESIGGSWSGSKCTITNLTINATDNISIPGGIILSIDGTLTNNGTLNNDGDIDIEGRFDNNGDIVNNSGTIVNFGIITNDGGFTNSGAINNNNNITNDITGTLFNDGDIDNDGNIDNDGTIDIGAAGIVENSGTINNSAGANMIISGTITNDGTFTNNGILTIVEGATGGFDNIDTFELGASGVVQNYDRFRNFVFGRLIVNGTINNNSPGGTLTIQNLAIFTNNELLYNNATITIDAGGLLNNASSDTVENDCGGTITGTIIGIPAEDVCPPVANDQSVTTDEDESVMITLSGTNPDADSDFAAAALTFIVMSQPSSGTLSGTAPNLMYTPNADFNGADSFTFSVNDGANDSTAATVSITVNAVAEEEEEDEDDDSERRRGGGGGGKRLVIVNPQDDDEPSVTAYHDSHFEENPLDRMGVTNASFLDATGISITKAGVGQQMGISATIANPQQEEQEYAFIVQITEEQGSVVYVSWQQGVIESGETAVISTIWMPDAAGRYSVGIFVWDGIGRFPDPLSQVTKMNITVL